MRKTTYILLTLFTVGLFFTGAQADSGLKLIWEVDGLSAPESVIYDKQRDVLIVSNVNGGAMDKDGNGFLSHVSLDGKLLKKKWVVGLNGPKGLAHHNGVVYVADIDKLVAVDMSSGKISASYEGKGSKFLNDVAATPQGVVYVSDMLTNRIYRLKDGKFTVWLESPKLESPNGLLVEGDTLVVGAWGVMTDGFGTKVPGHLKRVSLTDKSITDIGGTPIGNMDGVEPADADSYYVTDWIGGKLFNINKRGEAKLLLKLTQGTADHTVIAGKKLLLLPMMMSNKMMAYQIKQ